MLEGGQDSEEPATISSLSPTPCTTEYASSRSAQSIGYAILIAGLLHIGVFVLLHSLIKKQADIDVADSPTLSVRLSETATKPITMDERSRFIPPDDEPKKVNTAPAQNEPIAEAPATRPGRSVETPSPPANKSVLQQYLSSGELPESVIERLPSMRTEPVEDLSQSTIFSPLLRQQVRRAKARRKASGQPLQQHYTQGTGDQFERQGDKCFIGRNMISEGGTNRIWYPTKCPSSSTARAFEQKFNPAD